MLKNPKKKNFNILVIVYLFNCKVCLTENFFTNDNHSQLGFALGFKIHIDAGKEECFYQDIRSHTNLYVAFQVIKGGDGKAGFGIRDPYGNILLPYKWQESVDYEVELVQTDGVYQFCIDNSLSRFTPKLVDFYCSSYKRDEWENYLDLMKTNDGTVSNITSSLSTVDHNIGKMTKSIAMSKRTKLHDYLLLESNFEYVQNFSIMQCIIMIICSISQIIFLKKLFMQDSNSKTNKPSA